jgi:hypothetical protein
MTVPDRDRHIGVNPDSHVSWASDGSFGSVAHLVFMARPHEPAATAMCGTVIDVVDTRASVPAHTACPRCLEIYREQARREPPPR